MINYLIFDCHTRYAVLTLSCIHTTELYIPIPCHTRDTYFQMQTGSATSSANLQQFPRFSQNRICQYLYQPMSSLSKSLLRALVIRAPYYVYITLSLAVSFTRVSFSPYSPSSSIRGTCHPSAQCNISPFQVQITTLRLFGAFAKLFAPRGFEN